MYNTELLVNNHSGIGSGLATYHVLNTYTYETVVTNSGVSIKIFCICIFMIYYKELESAKYLEDLSSGRMGSNTFVFQMVTII